MYCLDAAKKDVVRSRQSVIILERSGAQLLSNQILRDTMDGLYNISKVAMYVYDTEGNGDKPGAAIRDS